MAFTSLADDDGLLAEINTTPLVDVMLVLLIIFMVTMPVLNRAIGVELPRAAAQPEDLRPERIGIAIDAAGNTSWNGVPIDAAALAPRLAEAGRRLPKPELHLSADRGTRYERVVAVMQAGRSAGIDKLVFVTAPERP